MRVWEQPGATEKKARISSSGVWMAPHLAGRIALDPKGSVSSSIRKPQKLGTHAASPQASGKSPGGVAKLST